MRLKALIFGGLVAAASVVPVASGVALAQDMDHRMMHRHMEHRMMHHEMRREHHRMMRHEMRREMHHRMHRREMRHGM